MENVIFIEKKQSNTLLLRYPLKPFCVNYLFSMQGLLTHKLINGRANGPAVIVWKANWHGREQQRLITIQYLKRCQFLIFMTPSSSLMVVCLNQGVNWVVKSSHNYPGKHSSYSWIQLVRWKRWRRGFLNLMNTVLLIILFSFPN